MITYVFLFFYMFYVYIGANPLSSDVWNPGPHGLGGNGKGIKNCVNSGPFRAEVWSLIKSAGGDCLRRDFK